jgi:hypothetical protein
VPARRIAAGSDWLIRLLIVGPTAAVDIRDDVIATTGGRRTDVGQTNMCPEYTAVKIGPCISAAGS